MAWCLPACQSGGVAVVDAPSKQGMLASTIKTTRYQNEFPLLKSDRAAENEDESNAYNSNAYLN